jgi:hypothetical protein
VSTIATTCQYVRVATALWRDTGLHVLVLPHGTSHEVVVLGGGSAVVWRLLAEPVDSAAIAHRLGREAGEEPDPDVVTDCLEDLADRGVVARLIEEDAL